MKLLLISVFCLVIIASPVQGETYKFSLMSPEFAVPNLGYGRPRVLLHHEKHRAAGTGARCLTTQYPDARDGLLETRHLRRAHSGIERRAILGGGIVRYGARALATLR